MALWKDTKTIIQVGHPEGRGRVLELSVNKDRFGLGFHSYQLTQKKAATGVIKGKIPMIPGTFTSTRNLKDNLICIVGGESNVPNKVCFVYQKTKGKTLNN